MLSFVLNMFHSTGQYSYVLSADWEKHLDEITIMSFYIKCLFCFCVIRRISENYVNIYDEFFSKSPESFVKTVGKWFDTQVSSVHSDLLKWTLSGLK